VPATLAAAIGAAVLAAAVAVAIVLALGGGKKQQVLGSVALEKPLAGAKVEFSNGAEATTSTAGNFLVSTSLPKSFSITTSGGTGTGQLTGITLSADFQNFDPAKSFANVGVLSTIVSRYRESHPDTSVAQAEGLLRKALSLPDDLSLELDQAAIDPFFSADRFLTVAGQSGGFDALVDKVTAGMAKGREVGRFPAPKRNLGAGTAASWVVGKLLGGAGDAVTANLMSRVGFDPATQGIQEINGKLTELSSQISALQAQNVQTLNAVLETSFSTRLDALPITSIRNALNDVTKFTKETDPDTRAALVAHFKGIAGPANFNLVVDKFNDLLDPGTPGSLSVVQHFVKKTMVGQRFWTPSLQQQGEDVFDYLDGMQVAAADLYIEYLNLTDPNAKSIAAIEAGDLRDQRKAQIARNPEKLLFYGQFSRVREATLDTKLRFWIEGEAYGKNGSDLVDAWPEDRYPTIHELYSIASGRGEKSVNDYLSEDLGLPGWRNDYGRFDGARFLWSGTPCRGGLQDCRMVLYMSDADTEERGVRQFGFVLLVRRDAASVSKYAFLWS